MDTQIDFHADIIDVRDIIERIEELEAELDQEWEERETTLSFEYPLQDKANWPNHGEEYDELMSLLAIMSDLKGYGGNEQWRGDWYPATLINERYFTDYARELIEDCGYISRGFPEWIAIDWEATAQNVRVDYSEIDIDGVTFYYR